MGEPVRQRPIETAAPSESDDDRAAAIVALAVSALSGFVVGLVVHGGIALCLLVLVLLLVAGAAGWWLRGAL